MDGLTVACDESNDALEVLKIARALKLEEIHSLQETMIPN